MKEVTKILDIDTYPVLVDRIAEYISCSDLRAGDRLPSERQMCQLFEVSRNTLREALRFLVYHSYLTVKKNSGYYIETEITPTVVHMNFLQCSIVDVIDAMNAIEMHIVGVFIKSFDAARLSCLDEVIAKLDKQDPISLSFIQTIMSYHKALCSLSDNLVLKAMMMEIIGLLDSNLHETGLIRKLTTEESRNYNLKVQRFIIDITMELRNKNLKEVYELFEELYELNKTSYIELMQAMEQHQ